MAMLPLLTKTSQPAVRSQTDYAEQAAHLIRTDLDIREIAASVGYASFPSFSKTFAAYFGQSPTSFRRKNRWAYDLRDDR